MAWNNIFVLLKRFVETSLVVQWLRLWASTATVQSLVREVPHATWSESCSVVSDSLWPHGLYPARLLCPWNSPVKNTGVGSRFLLQGIFPTQGSNLCLMSLALVDGFFTTSITWEVQLINYWNLFITVLEAEAHSASTVGFWWRSPYGHQISGYVFK